MDNTMHISMEESNFVKINYKYILGIIWELRERIKCEEFINAIWYYANILILSYL